MEVSARMSGIKPRRQSILIGQRSIDEYAGEEQQGPKFVIWIIGIFKKWGFIVAEHAWLAIFICLAISALSFLKILLTPQKNDILGYSPYGARANDEWAEYKSFFASDGLPVAAYLFIVAKDNGSMLRPDYMEESIKVLNYAMNNVTIHNRKTGINESYNQFCSSFCQVNEPVRQFYNGYQILSEGNQDSGVFRLQLRYPLSSVFGRTFSLQPSFFGVELFEDEDKHDDVPKLLSAAGEDDVIELNTTVRSIVDPLSKITNMKSVKMLTLQFRAESKDGWEDEDVKKWEISLRDIFERSYQSNKLKIYAYSQSYVEEEMVRGGIIMIPYLVVGFVIMCACSIATVMIRALYMHQQNFYKIILAIMACLTPLLACSTALALMFLCGMRFASILCVIPFLVLSIGVDSSYLMIHEWQRVTKHIKDGTIRHKDSVGQRMSEVLSEVGPAILISCLTNMFADGVGSFTSSPEITLLCTGNMVSMCVAFFYQMTFYAGLMAIVGRHEIEHEVEDKSTMQVNLAENRVNIARHHRPLTRQPSKFHETTKPIISKFMQRYIDFMTTPIVYLGVVGIYFLYLAFSIYGITVVNINLTASKLFALDSPLLELDTLRVTYQVPSFSMATVFVTNPGNFSDPERLKKMNQFVADMENIKGDWGQSWGQNGTNYFVRDFQVFQESFADDDYDEDEDDSTNTIQDVNPPSNPTKFIESQLPYFLKWPEYDFWEGFVKLENGSAEGEQKLQKFFFTTGFHGANLADWGPRGKMLHQWRDVVDQYPDFGASVFHEDGIYLDLIDNMPTDTWQSVVGTLAGMAFVCFIFLNNMFTVAIASLSVLSICAGILGILSWMGVDLDPITMAAMIISIGFSVDIPAHVSYHYYQASMNSVAHSRPADHLANCLSSVAFPAVQAALSTILCVCSLLFVNLYMAEVFVKTMVLCVVLCNLHGLLFLPAVLIMLDNIRWALRPKGAAAQVPPQKFTPRKGSRGRTKNSQIQPAKSSVPDRPEI